MVIFLYGSKVSFVVLENCYNYSLPSFWTSLSNNQLGQASSNGRTFFGRSFGWMTFERVQNCNGITIKQGFLLLLCSVRLSSVCACYCSFSNGRICCCCCCWFRFVHSFPCGLLVCVQTNSAVSSFARKQQQLLQHQYRFVAYNKTPRVRGVGTRHVVWSRHDMVTLRWNESESAGNSITDRLCQTTAQTK